MQTKVLIKYGQKSTSAEILCIEGNAPPLLGRNTAEILCVLQTR